MKSQVEYVGGVDEKYAESSLPLTLVWFCCHQILKSDLCQLICVFLVDNHHEHEHFLKEHSELICSILLQSSSA